MVMPLGIDEAGEQDLVALLEEKSHSTLAELVERYGAKLVLDSNRYATLVDGLGLRGPFAA